MVNTSLISGVKVHVRVIGGVKTGGDDDDTTLHVLSEEESSTFQNMIVAILVSGIYDCGDAGECTTQLWR